MKKLLTLFLIPITVMAINACHPDDVYEEFGKPTDVVNPHPVYATDFSIATLGDLAEKLGLKLGAAFTKSEYFNNDSVAVILKREFKAVTFGNEMKHDAIVQNNGKLKFTDADEMLGYADSCDVEVFGHVLGWHSQTNETYLNGLIDKASADNSASLLQTNWNFEEGSTTGFTASGFTTTKEYLEVFAGEYAAKASGDNASLAFTVDLVAGKAYTVSFWAKAAAEAELTLTTGDGQSATTTVGTEWAKYSVTFQTKSLGDFSYQITAGDGVCIDNIRVVEEDVEQEEGGSSGSYANPYAIGVLDFEDYTLGETGSDLLSNHAWTQFNGASYGTVTNEQHNSGSQSLKLDNSDGHCSGAWDIQAITPTFDVEAGKTYRIAWYSMATEEADFQIDIREDGTAKSYPQSKYGAFDKTGTSWTFQYVDYTVEAGSTLSVAFYGGVAAVAYYIDDIQVYEPIYEGDYTNYLDKNNLLFDGDFEKGTSGNWSTWTSYGEIISRNDPEEGSNADFVHSGIYALKIDNSAGEYSGGDAWKAQWANSTEIEVTAGQSYRIGLWAYSPDGYETVQIEAVWNSGSSTNYRQISGITDKWGFIYLDLVAPEEATTLQLKIDGFYSVGTVYIDDVQVYPTPVDSYIESNAIGSDDFESYSDGATGSDLVNAGYTQCNGASYVTVTSAEAHSGNLSVKLANGDGHCSGAWDIQLITAAYDVEAGKTYRIAWYSKATEEADFQIDIRVDGEAKSYPQSKYGAFDKTGTDWTYQYYDYTVEEGSTLSVAFYGGVAAVDYYIDDFQIFEPSTTTSALKAARGFGKYPTWKRPAPAQAKLMSVAAGDLGKFSSVTKLDGELATDAIGFAFKNFVYGMVEHFDVYAWDTINETFTEDGNFRTAENTSDGFVWGTYFADTKTWVDKAFAYATDALSKYGKSADLYINDYNLETSAAKRAAFCDYAANNSQVTGVASQMHLSLVDYDLETLKTYVTESLTDLVATGKKVRISELDIATSSLSDQATLYVHIFDQYLSIVPEAQRGGITIWGINDKDSWIGESKQPLLWTGNKYTKKLAYESLYKYLCEKNGIDYNIYD